MRLRRAAGRRRSEEIAMKRNSYLIHDASLIVHTAERVKDEDFLVYGKSFTA